MEFPLAVKVPGGVNNVLVENNTFEGSMYGIRIKSPRGKGGEVKNIVYRNTKMHNVEVPLVFSAYYKAAPIVEAELEKLLQEGGLRSANKFIRQTAIPNNPSTNIKRRTSVISPWRI